MDNNENNVESSKEDSDSNDDCGSYSTPPEYEQSPPRSRSHPDEDDPEYDPTEDHQNNDQSSVHSPPWCRRTFTLHEEEVATSTPQTSATTASSSNPERKHGQQSRNQIPEKGSLVIEELGAKGEPILPEGISTTFRNICGAIVRDKLQNWITTSNWKKVPTTTKDVLWATVKGRFTFPEGQEKFTRNIAEGLLGRCFRNWRSTFNKEYVQKGKNARDDFVQTTEEHVKAMKATENPHHFGSGGYAAKIAKWRREEEERRRAGLLDMFAGLDERSRNWPDREKDQLTTMIGTVEHSGYVRAMSSTLPWGKAFPNNQARYRKRDRYKKNLEEKMREITKQQFLDIRWSTAGRTNHATCRTGFVAPSSASSIANVRYPIDDIQVDTPCRLVGYTSTAVTGHVFPKAPLPEYAWVQVVTVLDESYEIDIPTNEGIEVLGDTMNQYILWHRRDIILNASPETSRPSQELPLPDSNVDTEQPTLSHV
ncbi:hypothetical protein SETIT_1G159300v2 [Setaria italica]|uniref:DUF8039 domain-containing protein n=1 Tax=Setaria italica TaxID=4555 RepID=A0A368PKU2_SETIT|nr:hypothetical protein SETIT_1G159300v2 [Setaria italica]